MLSFTTPTVVTSNVAHEPATTVILTSSNHNQNVVSGENNNNYKYSKAKYGSQNYRPNHYIPWLKPGVQVSFHEEIHKFAKWVSLTMEERKMRKDVIRRVKEVVLRLWPNAKVLFLKVSHTLLRPVLEKKRTTII
jgi:DNA polymerase sigma